MKKKQVVFEFTSFNSLEDLPSTERQLMDAAVQARENAYAPYSNFNVGAAVLLANGEVVIGNNQENASYPSGLCAERVAIFQAGARYPNVQINMVAITATSRNYVVKEPAAPCGNCRQAMSAMDSHLKTSPVSPINKSTIGVFCFCSYSAMACLQLPQGAAGSFTT
ncbi:MAG: cytidine deaminase [Bacteroidota bacterium]